MPPQNATIETILTTANNIALSQQEHPVTKWTFHILNFYFTAAVVFVASQIPGRWGQLINDAPWILPLFVPVLRTVFDVWMASSPYPYRALQIIELYLVGRLWRHYRGELPLLFGGIAEVLRAASERVREGF